LPLAKATDGMAGAVAAFVGRINDCALIWRQTSAVGFSVTPSGAAVAPFRWATC